MDELFGQIEDQIRAIQQWALVLEVGVVTTAVLVLVFGIIACVLLHGINERLDRLAFLQRQGPGSSVYGPPTGTPHGPPAQYGPMPRYGNQG